MSPATLKFDQILKTPFPSYHKPLELARSLTRSGNEDDRRKAVALLDGLRQRYPHVLAIGQELVLALEECHEPDQAERTLKALEKSFLNLDEEFLCRWGRLFKDRGDEYTPLPWSRPDGRMPDPVLAESFYRKSLEKYDQAYRIRFGHYPGINKATLLLILGSLTPPPPSSPPRPELQESPELAGKLLANRPNWTTELPDDLTVWHPATAGEAHLLRREWPEAANQYREALQDKALTPHARESMRRQVERIVMCFRNLSVSPAPPFDNPLLMFCVG
jgi:tetratricopeptide (TPR) repeat protein